MKQKVLPQNAVEVRPDNPYDGLDRGLFMLRQVQTTDGLKQDVLARIGNVRVEAYQGDQTVSAITYQVLIWDTPPTQESDYAKAKVFIDPIKKVDTFSFSALTKDYDVFTLEGYCINHLLRTALDPERTVVEDMEARYRLFKSHEGLMSYSADNSLAVSHVRHVQKFVSEAGKPFKLVSSKLRYRGYPCSVIGGVPHREAWDYKENAFIEYLHEVGSSRLMVSYALDHFAKPETQAAAQSLLIP